MVLNKNIMWLIVGILSMEIVLALQVPWEDSKIKSKVDTMAFKVLSPTYFQNCNSYADGWDNCTVAIELTNLDKNISSNEANAIQSKLTWSDSKMIRNVDVSYSHVARLINITTIIETQDKKPGQRIISKNFSYNQTFLNFTEPTTAKIGDWNKNAKVYALINFQRKNLQEVSYNFSITSGIKSVELDPTVSACSNLVSAGTYTLTQNVSSNAGCFNIWANDVTLDCAGYWINYSKTSTGVGIYSNATNSTIKNCFINQSLAHDYSSGIELEGNGIGANVFDCNLFIKGGYFLSHGIYIAYSNNFINSVNITTYGSGASGIYIKSGLAGDATNNTIANSRINASAACLGNEYGYNQHIFLDYGENYQHHNYFINLTLVGQDICQIMSAEFQEDDWGTSGDNFFLNISGLNRDAIGFYCDSCEDIPTEANNLTIQWYIRANVSYSNGTLIQGANVNATEKGDIGYNVSVNMSSTNANGLTDWFVLNDSWFWYDNSPEGTGYTPHNFTAKYNTSINSTIKIISESQTIPIILSIPSIPLITKIVFRNYQSSSNANLFCFVFYRLGEEKCLTESMLDRIITMTNPTLTLTKLMNMTNGSGTTCWLNISGGSIMTGGTTC